MNQSDINALLNNTATIETKIEILPKVSGESIVTITNDNSVKSWTYSDLRYVEDVGFIGQFVARTLDGELQDITDDFNIQDREIKLYIGIRVPNEQGVYSTTYYCLGNFLVQAPESDEVNDNTKFESFDYTVLFNKEFDGDFKNTTYTKSFNEYIDNKETVTALWLAQYTCAQAGVVLGTTNFLNNNFTIDTNQFDSTSTCRDVVKSIAKLAYTWARIGWDNKLYFDFTVKSTVEQTYNNITNDNYYSLVTQKEKYGPVNRVLIGTSFADGDNEHIDDAASISANGLHELFIYDNPLTYTEEIRKQVINSGNCLFGLTYTALDMETTGHPWLQGNELISVEDMEGNKLYTYPFDRVIKYNGHIKSQITSYAKTGQEESMIYEGDDSDYGKYKKTQIILDRQNQEITAISEKVDMATDAFKISNQVSGTTVETENAGSYLPLNFTFYGDSYQEIRSGLNLFPLPLSVTKNGITYIKNNNGTFNINGTATANTSISIVYDLSNTNITNGTYTISCKSKGYTAQIDLYTSASSYISTPLYRQYGEDLYSKTGNIPINSNVGKLVFQIFVPKDKTLNLLNETIMLNKGNEAVEFEPFGISPSPEYPSEIDVLDGVRNLYNKETTTSEHYYNPSGSYVSVDDTRVSNYINVKEGKYVVSYTGTQNSNKRVNFFDNNKNWLKQDVSQYNNWFEIDVPSNAVYMRISFYKDVEDDTILIEKGDIKHSYVPYGQNYLPIINSKENITKGLAFEQGAIGANNTNTYEQEKVDNTTRIRVKDLIKMNENETYYVDFNETYNIVIQAFNSEGKHYNINDGVSNVWNTNKFSFKGYSYIAVAIRRNDGADINVSELNNVNLSIRAKVSHNIPIGDMFFGKIGDAQDSGYVDFSTSKVVRNGAIGKMVLNGTENISSNPNGTNSFYIPITGHVKNPSLIGITSSHFKGIKYDDRVSGGDNTIYLEYQQNNMTIRNTTFTSVNSFKTWLIDNPVTVYYILAEPMSEEKDLTEEELNQLELDAGYNMLYINDILEPKIDLTYLTDSDLNNVYSTQSQLKLENNKISSSVSETQRIVGSNYDEVNSKLDKKLEDSDLGAVLKDYASSESVLELTSKVDTYQTSTEQYIGVVNNIKQNGVDKITTETGYTFDKTGLTVSKTGADTKTTITEDGMHIYNTTGSTPIEVQRVDSSGVYSENVKINTYLIVGTHCRFENYEDGTGAFYIG